jgi:hypothetical protein
MEWVGTWPQTRRLKRWAAFFAALLLIGPAVFAYDDAVVLSRRVPDQAYYAYFEWAVLEKGNNRWFIPLWSSSPAQLKIIKVLRKSTPPAPYAIEITVGKNERIDGEDNVMRLQSIHLLAASLDDAIKMRRALIAEITSMQRHIEKRQGNPPGHFKRILESQQKR